jgi:hypothetical protein
VMVTAIGADELLLLEDSKADELRVAIMVTTETLLLEDSNTELEDAEADGLLVGIPTVTVRVRGLVACLLTSGAGVVMVTVTIVVEVEGEGNPVKPEGAVTS